MSIPPPNPLSYEGAVSIPYIIRNFAPTASNTAFGVPTVWINPEGGTAYLLVSKANNSANWTELPGPGSGLVDSLTGSDAVVVSPDADGNINLLGSGSITTSGITHTETISLTGLTNHNVLVGAGTSTITKISPSTATFVLTSNGVSADPSFQAVSASGAVTQIIPDSGTTISPLAGQILVSGGSTGMEFVGIAPDNLDLSGVLQVDNGGTNAASFTAYSVICGGTTSTGSLQNVSGLGSSGQVLVSNGAAALPSWQANANGYSPASIVVSPTAGQGDYTTIAAALAAASSGQDILIKAGIYTENLTLKDGVDLVAWDANSYTPIVTIVGKCSASFAGAASYSGICFQTNGDYAIEVTGSANVQLYFTECFIYGFDHSAVHLTTSGTGKFWLYECTGDLGAGSYAYFVVSSNLNVKLFFCIFENNGGSAAVSTFTAPGADLYYSVFRQGITMSGTSNLQITGSSVVGVVTTGGTANTFVMSNFSSGSASAISVSTGGVLTIANCTISSSNTNALTGLGTVNTGGNACTDSSGNNVSTINHLTII